MNERELRLRCLEAATEYAGDLGELFTLADMLRAYVNGDIERIEVSVEQADALNEREEGEHHEH